MFATGDYVFYASGGICRVEDIQRAPLPGMPEDRVYYVLRSLHDANGISYLPTDCTTVFLRPILTETEAERFLKEANDVEMIDAPDAKSLRNNYQEAMRKYLPDEWFRVLKTIRERPPKRKCPPGQTFGNRTDFLRGSKKVPLYRTFACPAPDRGANRSKPV